MTMLNPSVEFVCFNESDIITTSTFTVYNDNVWLNFESITNFNNLVDELGTYDLKLTTPENQDVCKVWCYGGKTLGKSTFIIGDCIGINEDNPDYLTTIAAGDMEAFYDVYTWLSSQNPY